jgi:hypothetical protein
MIIDKSVNSIGIDHDRRKRTTDCDIDIVVLIRILVIGTAHGWFKKISTRIHIDQILEACAQECHKLERLEIQWDQETLRWNDNSSKFIDHIR